MDEFNLQDWLDEITAKIKEVFVHRVIFIGYQGSYKRGEAKPSSDIDMVVILDKVDLEDLKKYRKIIRSLPFCEKACGFIGGRDEAVNWPKSDIFQLIYDTEAIYGSLEGLALTITKEDVRSAVKNGAANIYHAACHSFLYDEEKEQSLKQLYKPIFFILQAVYFLRNGEYVCSKRELLEKIQGIDKLVLEKSIYSEKLNNIENDYKLLIEWSSVTLSCC